MTWLFFTVVILICICFLYVGYVLQEHEQRLKNMQFDIRMLTMRLKDENYFADDRE